MKPLTTSQKEKVYDKMNFKKTSVITASVLGMALLCAPLASQPAVASEVHTGVASIQNPNSAHSTPEGQVKRHHHRHHFGGFTVKTTADLIGVDKKELVDQLKTGRTLVQIVQEKKGWSESEYLKKLTDISSKRIDTAVQSGKIDAEKANKLKSALPAKLKEAINRNWAKTFSKPDQPSMFKDHQAKFVK